MVQSDNNTCIWGQSRAWISCPRPLYVILIPQGGYSTCMAKRIDVASALRSFWNFGDAPPHAGGNIGPLGLIFCMLCLSCILHIILNECMCALSKPHPSNCMQLGDAPPPTVALVVSWICWMLVPNYWHFKQWIVLKSPSTLNSRWFNLLLTGYINIIHIGIRLQAISKSYLISRCNHAC